MTPRPTRYTVLLSGLLTAFTTSFGKPAWAAAAHYHPQNIAQASEQFSAAASLASPGFDDAQSAISAYGRAAEGYSIGVALLGESAPEGADSRAQGIRRNVAGQYLRLQRHVDLLQDDFQEAFEAALGRAISQVPGAEGAIQCSAPPRFSPRAPCEGKSLNEDLARVIDQDPILIQTLEEIAEVPWPILSLEPGPEPVHPITGINQWALMSKIAMAAAEPAMILAEDDLQRALDELADGMTTGNPAAVDAAYAARARYDQALADIGLVLQDAMQDSITRGARKGGPKSLGLCALPSKLGGCPGEDATEETLQWIRQDRRFRKATQSLRGH